MRACMLILMTFMIMTVTQAVMTESRLKKSAHSEFYTVFR